MELRALKTNVDYEAAFAELERIASTKPEPGSNESDRLEILAILIESYEREHFPADLPSPIQAIQFRMEQLGLTQKDIVPYLGSRSRVSEVFSGRRPLSLSMIRALHSGLGIPLEVLVQDNSQREQNEPQLDWSRFPLRQLVKRGWIEGKLMELTQRLDSVARAYLAPLERVGLPSFHKTQSVRGTKSFDEHALLAWTARVLWRAKDVDVKNRYVAGTITDDFLRLVAQLSWSEQGPLLARELLAKKGIVLIVEAHLPQTYLDGAAILASDDLAIVALTLRHDRIDSFWFTLLHELVHLARHVSSTKVLYFDDLEAPSDDAAELEADDRASEALVPQDVWRSSSASYERSAESIVSLAEQLHVHPAVVAGKVRQMTKNFRVFSQLVGQGKVRRLFSEVNWSARC